MSGRFQKRIWLSEKQREELFTLTNTEEQRQRFVEQLLGSSHESNLTVVVTLRADFYGQAIKIRDLSDCATQELHPATI